MQMSRILSILKGKKSNINALLLPFNDGFSGTSVAIWRFKIGHIVVANLEAYKTQFAVAHRDNLISSHRVLLENPQN